MAEYTVQFLPGGQSITVAEDANLLEVARNAGLTPNAPCGGKGTCGKCKVRLLHRQDQPEVLACQTKVTEDMTVRFLSEEGKSQVISTRIGSLLPKTLLSLSKKRSRSTNSRRPALGT